MSTPMTCPPMPSFSTALSDHSTPYSSSFSSPFFFDISASGRRSKYNGYPTDSICVISGGDAMKGERKSI